MCVCRCMCVGGCAHACGWVLQPWSVAMMTECFFKFHRDRFDFTTLFLKLLNFIQDSVLLHTTQYPINSIAYIIIYNHWTKTINTPEQNCSNVLPFFFCDFFFFFFFFFSFFQQELYYCCCFCLLYNCKLLVCLICSMICNTKSFNYQHSFG